MESVNQHLKKISQIPSGLKNTLHADLIRKLTSVVPEPMLVTGKTTVRPEILIKHRGSPTPGGWHYETNSVESRLDPVFWNKNLNPRKSIRFFPRDNNRTGFNQKSDAKKLRFQNKKDKIMSTLKPKLKSILQKYASTTIDPIQLIKKYRKSLKSTTLPSTISRKYPTKFYVGEKETQDKSKDKMTTSDTDAYNKYTTSSSFRNKDKRKKHTTTEPTRKEIKFHGTSSFGEKLFTTEEVTFIPTVPTVQPRDEVRNTTTAQYVPTPLPIVQSRGKDSQDLIPSPFNIQEYQKRKSFHTTLVPVKLHKASVAPTNMVLLDDYYNKNVMGGKRRRLHLIKEKPKGFGQSLKDIFFPNTPTRRIIKVKKPKPQPILTTMKPIYTTLKAIQNKFPSILIDPYKQMRLNKQNNLIMKKQGMIQETESYHDFPYKFHKPIASIENRPQTYEDELSENSRSRAAYYQGLNIDRQLLSPTDPGLDVQEAIKTYLPALISLGTGLGIALHTLLNNWDTHIQRDMLPSLSWIGDEVTITYDAKDNRDMDESAADLIPIAIDSRGNVNLGTSGGRNTGYSMQDPELADIILNLLPEEKRDNPEILNIRMDKYVFVRVILTYLYNSSMEFLN
eukprot:TRINITY_DN16973_c0_g1_i1.p1 TRINITY_DN16973_c0_g1~~TRINITY_DN16973_c0_g1_i1.p1  ORF type:complete len:620 (-),score=99.64 TRINITY_DN16973_c0_g1_i1:77-1936(-)